MKKVVLIIGNRFQQNACGFIKEAEKLNIRIHGILCLQPKQNIIYYLKIFFQILRFLKPFNVKKATISAICKICHVQTFEALKNSWNNKGENSWDLLENGFDIFNYAKKKNIPLQQSPFLSPAIIRSYTKNEPTIFPVYAGGILSKEILNNANAEFINAHMGEMPHYRGMNVIEWAVLENQQPKVAVMVMNEKIDGGDVIWHKKVPFNHEKTIGELRRTGYIYCYKAMAEGISQYLGNNNLRQKQPGGAKYYYRMHGQMRKLLESKLPQKAVTQHGQ